MLAGVAQDHGDHNPQNTPSPGMKRVDVSSTERFTATSPMQYHRSAKYIN